jgi:hypothetical protein
MTLTRKNDHTAAEEPRADLRQLLPNVVIPANPTGYSASIEPAFWSNRQRAVSQSGDQTAHRILPDHNISVDVRPGRVFSMPVSFGQSGAFGRYTYFENPYCRKASGPLGGVICAAIAYDNDVQALGQSVAHDDFQQPGQDSGLVVSWNDHAGNRAPMIHLTILSVSGEDCRHIGRTDAVDD